jgi:hypothetical protein
LAGLCSLAIPFGFGQALEAVANLPLRLAVRAHCGQPSAAGYSTGTHSLHRYTGVLTAYSRGAHSLYVRVRAAE